MLNSSPAPAIPANFTRQPDGAFVDTETGEVYETLQRQRATWRAILEFYDQHPDGTPREAAQHVKFVLGE